MLCLLKKKKKSEKAMAAHSSTLAWKIPWTEEPGGLQSMGLLGVGHDWVTSLSFFTFMHWRRKWQPTPVLLPGESQEQGSLVGCCPWGCRESDMTEANSFQIFWGLFNLHNCVCEPIPCDKIEFGQKFDQMWRRFPLKFGEIKGMAWG